MNGNNHSIQVEKIIASIVRIEMFTKNMNFADFIKNPAVFDACLMQFIVIGETVNRLNNNFKDKYPALPWNQATGMRNQIAHGYFEVTPEEAWKTIKEDLPNFKEQLSNLR